MTDDSFFSQYTKQQKFYKCKLCNFTIVGNFYIHLRRHDFEYPPIGYIYGQKVYT